MSEAYNLEHIASRNAKQNKEATLTKEVVLSDVVDLGADVADAVKALQAELAELRRILRAAGDTAIEKPSTDTRSN